MTDERVVEVNELIAQLQAENDVLKRVVAEQRDEIKRLTRPTGRPLRDPTRF